MAKPNYSYEKRQRELAKKKKKEEKLQRKAEATDRQSQELPPEETPGTASDMEKAPA